MNALVTGGGGFLGAHIVRILVEQGHTVRFLARGKYPEVEALGAEGLQVDLVDADAVNKAVEGCDVVFHVAAKAGYWGDKNDFFAINLDGTRNVIDACKAHGVKKLIYTSTPSVVGYDHDTENAPRDIPYADVHRSHYPASKAEAEQLVLGSNGPELATVSLRPHLIFGPGDWQLLPKVITRAKTGKLPIVGDGQNKVDMTYVENAAWAHLDAAEALTDHTASCAGKAYFISNAEPVVLWQWINDELLGGLGVPKIQRKVGLGTANTLGGIMEFLWNTFPLSGEPRMTRFLASGLARSHWYDMQPAFDDLGYTVRVDMAEGTKRTLDWFQEDPSRQHRV